MLRSAHPADTVTKCSAPPLSVSVNSATNRITNTGFAYDNAGNLTSNASQSYTWNAESRVTATAGVTYTYDGDGWRRKKSSGTLYWTDLKGNVLAESDLSGNVTIEFIYFAGKRIARRDAASGNVYYFFSDHLGTARIMTDATGVTKQESDYYPFGGERVITNTIANAYKFSGKERDNESGLDFSFYRMYSPSLGRWMSPDPVRGTPQEPQTHNLYPYVQNNPANFVDALGNLRESPREKNDAKGGPFCSGHQFDDEPFLRQFFQEAKTLVKKTSEGFNCKKYPNGITTCEYRVTPNCTPETSPPSYRPRTMEDQFPWPGWWTTGLCARLWGVDQWRCGPLRGKANGTPQVTPGVCTKLPEN